MSDLENIDDELLSAYLDDELSPDERARVDVRLVSDPVARQTLEQLRVAAQAVQGLPHETVGEDLRESILRRAEAAMLTSNGSGSAAAANQPVARADKVEPTDSLPRITIGRTRRAWVWASLAMAAGLLIMVFQPGEQGGENLSQVAATSRAKENDKFAIVDRTDVPELSSLRIAEPAAAPAAGDLADFDAEKPPAASAPVAGSGSIPMSHSIALDTAPAAPFGSSSTLRDDAGVAISGGAMPARAPAATNRFSTPAEQPSQQGGGNAEGLAVGQLGDGIKVTEELDGRLANGAVNGPAPASVAASERELAETPTPGARGGEMQFGATVTDQPAPADAFVKAPAPAEEDDFLVVHVVVDPQALRSKAFDQLLSTQGIQFEDRSEAGAKSRTAPETRDEASSIDRKLQRSGGGAQDESGKQSAEEVVLVSAPRETIESCLAALKLDQRSYFAIAIDDPTAERATVDDAEKSKVEEARPTDVLVTDLETRFNRGSVPPQNMELARDKYFYESRAEQSQQVAGRRGFGGGGGGARRAATKPEQEQLRARSESLWLDALGENEPLGRGRARRIRSWGFDDGQNRDLSATAGEAGAERRASLKEARQIEAVQDGLQASAETKPDDRLRVLFFLSPAAGQPAKTAPSPPAENRQE